MSSQLQQDVFSASAEFIRLIVDPDSVVPVNWHDGKMPFVLPESFGVYPVVRKQHEPVPKLRKESDEAVGMGNVFRHEDDAFWHIRFVGDSGIEEVRMSDVRGLHHIAFLLQRPGELVECSDIDPRESEAGDREMAFQEVMDKEARRAVMLRIRELEDAYVTAEETGNDQRLAEAKEELDQLKHENAKAMNRWGRSRRLGPLPERKRAFERVRKNFGRACDALEPTMPHLTAFLRESIRSDGTAFRYHPPFFVDWML